MPPAHECSANQASLTPDGDLNPNDREQPFENNNDNHHGERDDYKMDYGTDGNIAPDISRDANEIKVQISAGDIDKLMHLWGLGLTCHGDAPPFADHWDLYSTINETPIGDIPWQSFSMKYSSDDDLNSSLTPWMDAMYTTWFCDPRTIIHNMLGNPDFKNGIDYAPYREWKGTGDSATRQWRNVMSGDWAWDQADNIAKDPATHGLMFVPVILRSDKTTVSVATGQNDYYLLYASIGNVHNNVRCAHGNTVAKQLFHSSLSRILSSLKPAMSIPKVVQFSDGHFRHVLYGLGPYIADYPEQLILGCGLCSWEVVDTLCKEVDSGVLWDEWGVIGKLVPFTDDFPHANIHQLLASDILHQVIEGAFKDHLVAWVEQHMRRRSWMISTIATALPFAGLCRFPQGCGFSQWTGDDSKALMKVYLPAIEGHIPQDIIRCFGAFLKFCYIVQQDIIAEDTLLQLSNYTGIRFDVFSLPHQHTLCHYSMLIFKEPWRHSSKFNAFRQMLLTNQHLDKLAASGSDFTACGMLNNSYASDHLDSDRHHLDEPGDGILEGPRAQCDVKLACTPSEFSFILYVSITQCGTFEERSCTHNIHAWANELGILGLPHLIWLFLYDQLLADDTHTSNNVPLSACPRFEGQVKHICAVLSWRQGPARNNTVFINTGSEDGINGMEVSHVLGKTFPCALIHWFKLFANKPNPDTGMWMSRSRELSIVHVDTIVCACHLLPIFDAHFTPEHITLHNILDLWPSFYVKKFIDHHAVETYASHAFLCNVPHAHTLPALHDVYAGVLSRA
ncbi:uncharacterized protein F5891DRAFT_1125454 [Suillus fuscotomentosus]|uniref:Uncharacterized protein n=1 Tax=Suillus fuscotomentosus TaxID=1912939 RepID=A0AAD4EI95_9AGAM|nr:uncharacterized protein F5891DRAFT_1125454 [Suillus fuscotomentosus]KAG1906586.1 hypothetical protein F5891DRAFT_1125454 [Suillus fuscotomentosus]